MKLNAEDGGNRKFIMVQLPEKTEEKSEAYKAGYKNICEIGKERIRRAAKKIAEEKAEEFEKELIASRNKISRRANANDTDKSDAVMLFSDYCDRYVEERKPKLSASVYYGYKRYIPLFKKFFQIFF